MTETRPPAEGPDEAFARLRAADPAGDLTPDLTALRAAVTARAGQPDELAAARARRGQGRALRIAGAAASALVIGAGGFALGAAQAADEPEQGGDTAVLAVPEAGAETFSTDPQLAQRSATDSAGIATAPLPMSYYGNPARVVFTSSGLSGEAGSAQAYGFDPTAAYSEDTIRRLAGLLGVDGEPTEQDGRWFIGEMYTGSGAGVQIYADGMASFSYYNADLDPYACPAPADEQAVPPQVLPAPAEESAEEPGDGVTAQSMPGYAGADCEPTDLGPAPTEAEATAEAERLISSLGVDVDGWEYEVWLDEWSGAAYVTGYPTVDGARTGTVWSVAVTGSGARSVDGPLATLTDLGEYPVVSPAEAVERLSDPRFGAWFGGPVLYRAADGAEQETIEPQTIEPDAGQAAAPSVPAAPTAGASIAWPVAEATITGSSLSLSLYQQPDGGSTVVPVYQLTATDGAVWTVIAIADSHLDFAAR